MHSRPRLLITLGAVLVAAIGFAGSKPGAGSLSQRLESRATLALEEAGLTEVTPRFETRFGDPTRHPVLSGNGNLDDATRTRAAQLIASVPGVGGVSWADGTVNAESGARAFEPLHCQEDVDGLLRTRTIRFQEASAALLPASRMLLDEVAEALQPCVGAIIAITGHTDSAGQESANLALSMDRARVVREALVRRGIPRSSLRARGVGSSEPAERLTPEDPANRRIEFSVIRMEPLTPTPVDTPGPR